MKTMAHRIVFQVLVYMFCFYGLAFSAGGEAAPIVIVADTRNLTGVVAWWANLYNESHLYFTVMTVVLIPLIGLTFGILADYVMHFIGIDLKNRELAEH
jgi:hypothetical protein